MARSLGLARVPTLDPKGEGDYPSYEYVRSLVRALNANFEILNSAYGGTSDIVRLVTGIQHASVMSSQTTTSASYANLATIGPAVTVSTKEMAIVFLEAFMAQNTGGAFCGMSVAVSGDTTLAASDDNAIFFQAGFANAQFQFGGFTVITGLTPGENTFTLKYKAAGGGTATFHRRRILVLPLNE